MGSMFRALVMTMKPQSFLLSAISVTTGTALASLRGPIHWGYYWVTLLAVILLHGGSNVINDYFDYRQKVDTTDVPGGYGNEARVLIQKALRPSQVLGVALVFFAFSLALGIYMTAVRGWTVFFLGLVGFLTGFLYTFRPVALKYVALGEAAVFFMWGPLIVSGAYYVQRGGFGLEAVWISIPIGILVALVLLANNIRDSEFDSRVKIRTMGTVLGRRKAIWLYQFLLVGVYAITVLLILSGILSRWGFLTFLCLPLALKLVGMMQREVPADADARTAQLDGAFGTLFIVAILLERLV
jgi:1,4-dihydroxy-2-naphthoate octaprenyltransferase